MLARRGLSVCVVDRAQFPSETPSTHVIQPCGVQVLHELGVLDAVLAAGAVPLDSLTMVIDDDVHIDATLEESDDLQSSLCVRRVTLDALLVDAAAAAGADVRTGTRVTGLIREGGRVTGVQTAAGPIYGQLVVGADGRHSTVASQVGAREYHVAPAGKMFAWAYFDGVRNREGRAWIGRKGPRGFLAGPTDGDLYMAAIGIDMTAQAEFHADRDANFTAGLRAWPELADVLADGHRVGPIRVLTNWYGYFRDAAGPGWVLLGDAGHFKDPTPGQGIGDAFRQARRLAPAIEDGLGNTNPDVATQRWWQWRDDDAYEMYWFASDMGAPGAATPLMTRFMKDLSRDPASTMAFFQVLNREIRPSQLFTRSRGLRAAAHLLVERPGHLIPTLKEIVGQARLNVRRARLRRAVLET